MGVGLRLVSNPNGVIIKQPRGLTIGVAGQAKALTRINLTNGGQRLECRVGEIGVAALPILQPLFFDRRTCFGDESCCLTNRNLVSHGGKGIRMTPPRSPLAAT